MENPPYMHTYPQPPLTDKAVNFSKQSLFHILTCPHFISAESNLYIKKLVGISSL